MRVRVRRVLCWLGFVALLVASGTTPARGIYQPPDEFVREVYGAVLPKPQSLWLTPSLQTEVTRILGHEYVTRRVRYWRTGARSVWILEEIGKEEPITAGFVIDDGHLQQAKVLIYRESRGGEVRYPSFTEQFRGARLTAGNKLDRRIDNISGASLSVSALTRLARLALYFHSQSEP